MTWQFWTKTTELQTTTTLRIYLKLGLLLESQNLRIRRNPGLAVLQMTKSQCSTGYNEYPSRSASSHLWVQQGQNRKTFCSKVRLGYIARRVSQKQGLRMWLDSPVWYVSKTLDSLLSTKEKKKKTPKSYQVYQLSEQSGFSKSQNHFLPSRLWNERGLLPPKFCVSTRNSLLITCPPKHTQSISRTQKPRNVVSTIRLHLATLSKTWIGKMKVLPRTTVLKVKLKNWIYS